MKKQSYKNEMNQTLETKWNFLSKKEPMDFSPIWEIFWKKHKLKSNVCS